MSKKLEKMIVKIDTNFKEMGYDILEDIRELVDTTESVRRALEETSPSKIDFFQVEEENSVGFTLDEMQVNFFIEEGEDEEGPWYEAYVEIVNF